MQAKKRPNTLHNLLKIGLLVLFVNFSSAQLGLFPSQSKGGPAIVMIEQLEEKISPKIAEALVEYGKENFSFLKPLIERIIERHVRNRF